VSADVLVSVILVNYEGRGILGKALDGVARQTGVPGEVEVLVVDNASTDGSWDEAEGRPGVRLLRNQRNVGFGSACNQAAAAAQGRYLALLNYDSEPEERWLAELVAAAEARPEAGAVMGIVLKGERRDEVNTAGNLLHYLGFSWSPTDGAVPSGPPYEVTLGSGASLLVHRDRFHEVGGFWEEMFLYVEDADLSWRLRLHGYPILAAPAARSWHRYEFGRNPSKMLDLEKNRLLMLAANYEGRTLLVLAPALVATEAGLLAVAALQGWLPQKLRSWAAVAGAVPELRRQRRRVQRSRRVPDTAIYPHLETRLGKEFGAAGLLRLIAPLLDGYARLSGVSRSGQKTSASAVPASASASALPTSASQPGTSTGRSASRF
jgi:GT2 family glycosyltransferase